MNNFKRWLIGVIIATAIVVTPFVAAKVFADEIYDWSNTAANNNSAPPDGWPENMNYADVNNAAREGMAVIRRFLDALDGTNTTGGTQPAYTLSSGQSLSSGAAGRIHVWTAHASSTGAASLNVDGAGAKNLLDADGTQLGAGDIALNGIYMTVETTSAHRVIGALAGGAIGGPGSSTDNSLVRFDGTGGDTLQGSGVIVDDSNNVSGVGTLSSGAITSTGAFILSGTITGATTVDIGSTDTTLARSSAGDVSIEGNVIYRAGGTDAVVADGGTGRSSHTAYAVIAGGTTSTGAQQSVSGVGSSGQVLTSNGASALPTWQDASTSGADIQIFTSSGTWNKPSGYSTDAPVYYRMWGGGGGGTDDGCGGGGGYNEGWGRLAQFSSSESVTVGSGGALGTGATDGSGGGTSSFNGLSAFGGGGGAANGSSSGGGGGGGPFSAGGSVISTTGGNAGAPYIASDVSFTLHYGRGGDSGGAGQAYGGFWHGGGGAGRNGASPVTGGGAINGGGGGSRSADGGVSIHGGNGGGNGVAAQAPGGGGGCGTAQNGAAGRVEVYVFP